jgi:hypothetical protein
MKELKQMNRQGIENVKLLNRNILKANKMKKQLINTQHGLMKVSMETYRSTKSLLSSQSKADLLDTKMFEFNKKVDKLVLLKQKYNFLNA